MPTRILIIDDDQDDYFITSDYIRHIPEVEFHTDWCYRYKEALEIMKRGTYDIYFVDYRLGAKTGIDLLKEALQQGCEEPIILLTGKGNTQVDKEAMRLGATDYLVKSELNVEKLERCIRYALERSSSLKALRANEKKYRNIFERSKDAVFITDKQLAFLDFNNATCELFSYGKEELLKKNILDLVATDRDKITLTDKLRQTGEAEDLEIEFMSAEQERKTCIFSLSRGGDTDGKPFFQGIIHDITNLKKAERATLQAEKLAAAGRLVRTLAHEVRNPLNNINMAVEQLTHDVVQEEDKLYLDIIQRNSTRIGALITELLNSSRPTEIVMQPHTLQSIVDESLQAATDRILLHGITTGIHYHDSPLIVMADKEKLKIVFLNIIINAIEAMEGKKGHLEVEVFPEEGSHKVRITDNGVGISDENKQRLFEPYFTSKRNGMGLGLAASLNIIQSHKASIDVQSARNEGSSFIVTFAANSISVDTKQV